MYLNHFGLDESPFRITPHTDFFFDGANRGATLEALIYAIMHDEGIVKVSGEVGSGKTMLCRVLVERLPRQVRTILLANPALSRDEIYYAIADELDIQAEGKRLSVLLLMLQEQLITLHGENQRVVLLIDEAHAMPPETLEQVRLLSNLETSRAKLLQIVLFGQPELEQHLSLPQMRPLKERITHSFSLEPLRRPDIEAYIDFRMRAAGYRGPNVFAPEAVRRIVKASEGLTRRVNILADKSLLAAFADNKHSVSAKHADRAIRDAQFTRMESGTSLRGVVAAGAAAGLALGLGLGLAWHYLVLPPVSPASPAPPGPTSAPRAHAPTPRVSGQAPPGSPPLPTPNASAATAPVPDAIRAPAAISASAAPPAIAAGGAASAKQTSLAPHAPIPVRADATPAAAAQVPPAATPGGDPSPGATRERTLAPNAGDPAPAPRNSPPAPAGKLTRARFAATQEWFKTAPGDHLSIQLEVFTDPLSVEPLLARAVARDLKLSDFYVYGVKIGDRQYYRLAYGLYPTATDARQGIKRLPAPYRQFVPFLRSVARMRSLNSQ